MSLSRDMQELMHRVRRTPGYTVEISKGGHWKVRNMNGHLLVTAPSTPSDWRSIRNTVKHLKAVGVPLNGGNPKYMSSNGETEETEKMALPESQARLIANINAYLHDSGYKPKQATRNGNPRQAFVERLLTYGTEHEGFFVPKSKASADQSLTRLTRGMSIGQPMEMLMTAVLDELYAQEAEPEPSQKEPEPQPELIPPPQSVPLPKEDEQPKRVPIEPEQPFLRSGPRDHFDLLLRMHAAMLSNDTTREEAADLIKEVRTLLS